MKLRRNGLLLLGLFVVLGGNLASARNANNPLDSDIEIRADSHLPHGSSVGQPDTLDMILFEDSQFGFETIGDSVPESEDFSKWSDKKILRHYEAEIKRTNLWLDRIVRSQAEVARLNQDVEIARRRHRPQGLKMSGLTCLAIAIQGEAGGEPAAGKAAVAETIMTRAGGNPARVCSAVFARAQFEAMSKRARTPSAETMRIARKAIHRGNKCGFDHFINKRLQRALGRSIPSWVRTFERRGCRHLKIGLHDYYSSCSCRH